MSKQAMTELKQIMNEVSLIGSTAALLGWDERVTVVPPDDPGNDPSVAFGHDTCSYSGLVPLDADRALLVYSHFAYPDAQGRPCKTILCRTVSVAV